MLPRARSIGAYASGLFEVWRRLLGNASTAAASAGESAAGRAHALVGPDRSLARRRLELAGGIAALALGIAVDVALGLSGSRVDAMGAAISTVAWAVARLLLMRLSLAEPAVADRAWRLSLLPWIIGVTPELRVLAWVLSAIVAAVVLLRAGETRRVTLGAVGLGWGAQAVLQFLVSVARWLILLLIG